MAGADTFRGIGYQQAQAVHLALDIIESGDEWTIRVEGITDVVDIETYDANGSRVAAFQVKTRTGTPWTPKPIIDVFESWLEQPGDGAEFTFVTDQTLGPGAQKFADALDTARTGNPLPLTEIVGGTKASRLTNGYVRVAPDSVGSLLAAADRRAAALVDPVVREAAIEAGIGAVNALFRLLTERAGMADPADRTVTSGELRNVVGGLSGQPADARWPEALQAIQLQEALRLDLELVEMRVRRIESGADIPTNIVVDSGTAILSGGTGSGKSSMCDLLRRDAARTGRTILVGRAETYLTGRMDAFAADALGFAIGRALPPSTGRQLLADPRVTLILDGASEIPEATRTALAADLRLHLLRPGVATVVLVGRGLAEMRRLLPTATPVARFAVRPLDDQERKHLAMTVLNKALDDAELDRILQVADRQLEDGAHNPFLLTLYLKTTSDLGTSDLTRSDVYAAFLEALAARTGEVNIHSAMMILAHVFAELIAKQRRYSDAYEWIQLTDELSMASPQLNIDGAQVRDAALLSGIVNALGHTGTVAPFHDSIADYLAGLAHAQGIASTPSRLNQSDEQWVAFATEQRPAIAGELSELIVRDIPFAALGISAHDVNDLSVADLASRSSTLLQALVGDESITVDVTELKDGRRLISSSAVTSKVIVDHHKGALFAAVRLWRIALRVRLAAPYDTTTPRPVDAEAARAAVDFFAADRRRASREFLDRFPLTQRLVLGEAVGPLGLRAEVGAPSDGDRGRDWELAYWPDSAIVVSVNLVTGARSWDGGRSTVMSYCSGGPKRAASATLISTLERLLGRTGWLA
jgi:hypothetical protein